MRPKRAQVRNVRLRTVANLEQGTSLQRLRGRPVVYVGRCVERFCPQRTRENLSHSMARATLVSTPMVRSVTSFDAGCAA